ncbi:MAG TPA: T9SS type A sorting domain-containing protein, partial [Ignavibacteriaceae bacterium]|nr:T9SS type A sorting domain-containing protein [Ignavibacteriaceae bacterium]
FIKWPVLGVWVWPNYYVGETYTDEINYLKNWISARLNWMENNMIGEPTFVNQENDLLPEKYVLEQNYPNPFNPTTTISWQSPVSSWQTLKIYDVIGNEVATLVDEFKEAGRYQIEFDATELTSGVYFYQLRAGSFSETKKLILMR